MKAWDDFCSTEAGSVLLVPKNRTYHLKPITFSGPCKSELKMQVSHHYGKKTFFFHLDTR